MDFKLLLLYFSDNGYTGLVGEDEVHQALKGRLRRAGCGKAESSEVLLSLSVTLSFRLTKGISLSGPRSCVCTRGRSFLASLNLSVVQNVSRCIF